MNAKNIVPSFRYQLNEHLKPILYCYLILVVAEAALGLLFGISPINQYMVEESGGSFSGDSGVGVIILLILSLTTFRECFEMLQQNGVSRRSQFVGHLLTAGVVSAILTVGDTLFTLATYFLFFPIISGVAMPMGELFTTIYGAQGATLSGFFMALAQNFVGLLSIAALCYLFTVVFYRLSKWARYAVFGGGAILLFVGMPLIGLIPNSFVQNLFIAATNFIVFAFETPAVSLISHLVLFAILSALAWLVLRKTSVKTV